MYSINEGDIYYCVGPLQNSNGIEKWKYTNDKYDKARIKVGNVFATIDEAKKFKEYMKVYKDEAIK